ncbi:MAG: FprA family A-type flavoprotein [Oscillospiraceae bacterium]|nr:FprA family A-type flavoprotein [Oscillospiraceae bacterium]
MTITNDIVYVGVNDRVTDLFEGQYKIPNGISYNSYVILDEKIAVMDSVDASFGEEWLDNIEGVLGGRKPDYLVVSHMEPDHSANIQLFAEKYPEAKIVSSAKSFTMMKNFFGDDFSGRSVTASPAEKLVLGKHTLSFVPAPMVHWPEVIMTYDETDKVLFSADAFGKFGVPDCGEPWEHEARRYYIGIVGKYGAQVQAVLKKASALDIAHICPLHGPVLSKDLERYIGLYDTWSSYKPESAGAVIAYASIYGNTAKAAMELADKLRVKGTEAVIYDLARCDMSEAVASAFRYDRLVLASATYNADVFPPMRTFIDALTSRNYSGRKVGFIENGSWAPMAAKVMKGLLEGAKDITFADTSVKILSAPDAATSVQLDALAAEMV